MNNKETKIIDSVPGVERRVDDAPRHGEVVYIPEDEFRGDPSKVIGHPSNPATKIAEAYSRHLSEQEAARADQHPDDTIIPPISEVPLDVKNPKQP